MVSQDKQLAADPGDRQREHDKYPAIPCWRQILRDDSNKAESTDKAAKHPQSKRMGHGAAGRKPCRDVRAKQPVHEVVSQCQKRMLVIELHLAGHWQYPSPLQLTLHECSCLS